MKQLINGKYIFALLLVSTVVFVFYIYLATQNHFSQLEPMINGTAPKPYVYRVLTPVIIRAFSSMTDIPPFVGAVLVLYLSMIGFSFSMLALAKVFLPRQSFQICALFAPIGLVPFLFEQRHIYDFPTLFLFTLALYFLAKNDIRKYIIVFILATLSKETSLFLVIFFVLQFRKIKQKKFAFLIFVQLAIYMLIRFLLIMIFKNNPGGLLEFHLYDHAIAYSRQPVNTILLFSAFIIVFILGVGSSADGSNFVRNSLFAIGVPSLVLYFFFGVPFEVRIFLETYPSIFLSTCYAAIFLINRYANPQQ